MERISQDEFSVKIKPIKRKVFVNSDPFGAPFSENIKSRLLVFGYSYQIDPPLLDAIVETALIIGDEGFYISSLWTYEENDVKKEDVSPYSENIKNQISKLSKKERSLLYSLPAQYCKKSAKKDKTNHFYIPFSEIDVYSSFEKSPKDLRDITFSENILLSPTGKWGIILSHEHHALIGGSEEFIDRIVTLVPTVKDQVYEFFKHWKYYGNMGTDISWIPLLIEHIYGKNKSKCILKKSNLF
ncbi:hypothetical protein CKA32_001751 [Geitlerinema sp. FC II]|nr:hypothetical protein [Geitlerinema sp. CS-897]PPT09397.1 hypothetical protein CKA32_001751 [Geitlerinema sp. FC II]